MKSKLFCVAMALCMSFGVKAFAQMPNRGALTSKTGSRSLQRMHERGLVPKMWDDNRQWAFDSTVMVTFNGDGSYRERVALSYNRTTRCISMRSRYTEGNNLSASIQNGAWDIFYDNNDMLFQRLTYDVNLNGVLRSEEHTSELQSHSEISYAVFCLK